MGSLSLGGFRDNLKPMTRQFATRHLAPEKQAVQALLDSLSWDSERSRRIAAYAKDLSQSVRSQKTSLGEVETFLQQYPLHSKEGLALMTLAEALLRIPDHDTANLLIQEKIADASWMKEGAQGGWLMKGAGLGLNLAQKALGSVLGGVAKPAIRLAMEEAVRRLGAQFVLGTDIDDAIHNGRAKQSKGYRISFDMLGEGARTAADSERYFQTYKNAIESVGKSADTAKPLENRSGISVKLSALHPRYVFANSDCCVPEIASKVLHLAQLCKTHNIALTVDAEEADRLDISLAIFEHVARDASIKGWNGLGLAVQAYDKRAFALIDDLYELARETDRILHVRLVKGAYWDSEIKRAQIAGLSEYPVFTRKANTDLSYLACASQLLQRRDRFYPMFATHNAHTIAAVLDLAGANHSGFEFQRLHGMGEALHDQIVKKHQVTIYAPVGSYEDLLPYLVRRMLENGANTSFVQKIRQSDIALDDLVEDPVQDVLRVDSRRHKHVPLPPDLYGPDRLNAAGIEFSMVEARHDFLSALKPYLEKKDYQSGSVVNGKFVKSDFVKSLVNPANTSDQLGQVYEVSPYDVGNVFVSAKQGFQSWTKVPASDRATIIRKVGDLMEEHSGLLFALLIREAGKTIPDALAEIREAVDFCRYYAAQGVSQFGEAGEILPGPTGETNRLALQGRGVFVCISPWNFPLAIFTGQIVAALMAGNAVVAKPAEQTPLIAFHAVQLMHKAGVPVDVLHLVCGDGAVGAALTTHQDTAGVAFTGSTVVAQAINRALAARTGPIAPLIAETGGQNAMIADSSALPEQVIDDVLISAFGSTGQRCSALRVLYVQDSVADKIIEILKGAMRELKVGEPQYFATDVGPVIDQEALDNLQKHRTKIAGKIIAEATIPPQVKGYYFAPVACEIDSIKELEGEVFGPVLHIVRYKLSEIDQVLADINATGFGLTFGVHSRILDHIQNWPRKVDAGNVYVNRSMIGAVVGVQPFGGQGLSGTGPKAGGPHYLARFATEKTITVNTTATGGNFTLLMMSDS